MSKGMTQNQVNEVIIWENEKIMKLGRQLSNIMYDSYAEGMGLNREEGEGIVDYIKRVWNTDYFHEVTDNAFKDMLFENSLAINDKCTPCEDTYYFSYTTGMDPNPRKEPIPETASSKVVGYLKLMFDPLFAYFYNF